MQKVTFPNDGWAKIRDADEVPERLRRAYLEAQGKLLSTSGASVDDEGKVKVDSLDPVAMTMEIGPVRDALILAYTKEWSLEAPINLESIMDLPGGLYDALHEVCETAYKDGKGGQVDSSPAGALDPASPTAPLDE